MNIASLCFESGERTLSVWRFRVDAGLSSLFAVEVRARSPHDNLDLSALVGRPAAFSLAPTALAPRGRCFGGVVVAARAERAEPATPSTPALSTYVVTIAPVLHLLTLRRGCRLFQHQAIPDIIDALLREWGIEPTWHIDRPAYPPLELRVQYDETDYAFFCRLLEEAGITFRFDDALDPSRPSRLVLDDAPQAAEARLPIPHVDQVAQAQAGRLPYLTDLEVTEEIRPATVTLRDHDFWNPRFPLIGQARAAEPAPETLEQYHHLPGSFLREEPPAPTATPVADDRGKARFAKSFGDARAGRMLESRRATRRRVSFAANLVDLAPGTVFSVLGHPRTDVAPTVRLLVRTLVISGEIGVADPWIIQGDATFASVPYRPAMETPRPRILGLQSAVVVGEHGPGGGPLGVGAPGAFAQGDDGIYTDEHGRVRAQFPWDREGQNDARSSIWMRVSQGWAGAGHGLFALPRVGHEVLVAFLDGDPDCPLIVGRAHNVRSPPPYTLPENKTVSTFRTESSPGGGGFNELRFDDASGREHVYLQAERRMDVLVKSSLQEAIGADHARYVQNDEAVAIGRDRVQVVQGDETAVAGGSREQTIGLNRVSTVGVDDSTFVGSRWAVTVARGLTPRLGASLEAIFKGPLGSTLRSAASAVLGTAPLGPAGAGSGAPATLTGFGAAARATLGDVLRVFDGFRTAPGPLPTGIEVVDRRIELGTGEASIVLDGPNILLRAEGNVVIHAMGTTTVLGEREIAAASNGKIGLVSTNDDVLVQAAHQLHLNPYSEGRPTAPATPHHPSGSTLAAEETRRREEKR